MAVVYFDSSAFVKLLVEEEGSDLAAQLWDGCDTAVHLASSLVLGADAVVLAAWDTRLRSGAEAAEIRIAPASMNAGPAT